MMKKYYENEQVQDTLHIYTSIYPKTQESSVDTQKDMGVKMAKQLGMKSKLWNDTTPSPYEEWRTNRPVWRQLLGEVGNGSVKHLFFYNDDRDSLIDTDRVKYALGSKGAKVYTKDGEIDVTTIEATQCSTESLQKSAWYDDPNRDRYKTDNELVKQVIDDFPELEIGGKTWLCVGAYWNDIPYMGHPNDDGPLPVDRPLIGEMTLSQKNGPIDTQKIVLTINVVHR